MTHVDVLLYDGLDELDAVAPYEILAAAGFSLATVALDGAGPVRGAHGLSLGVDLPPGDPPEILVVPGGGWIDARAGGGARAAIADGRLLAWVRACHAAGSLIASVCTGSLMLEAAGLLAGGRPVVTHHTAVASLRALGANVLTEPRIVDDGDVLSAGGVSSGIDLAIHLIERFQGMAAAEAAAVRIEYARRGPVLITGRAGAGSS